jgi:hypothetical protein
MLAALTLQANAEPGFSSIRDLSIFMVIIMITNYLISPHPILQSFVDNYKLSTSNDEKLIFGNRWPASYETSLVFYLADKLSYKCVRSKKQRPPIIPIKV